nr:uncharacterized protein LOC109746429 [Aegilops tauschii subsp. strangulata]
MSAPQANRGKRRGVAATATGGRSRQGWKGHGAATTRPGRGSGDGKRRVLGVDPTCVGEAPGRWPLRPTTGRASGGGRAWTALSSSGATAGWKRGGGARSRRAQVEVAADDCGGAAGLAQAQGWRKATGAHGGATGGVRVCCGRRRRQRGRKGAHGGDCRVRGSGA